MFGVVEERVGQTIAGLEAYGVARIQGIDVPIQPNLGMAFDNEDKLVLRRLGMGPRSSAPEDKSSGLPR